MERELVALKGSDELVQDMMQQLSRLDEREEHLKAEYAMYINNIQADRKQILNEMRLIASHKAQN